MSTSPQGSPSEEAVVASGGPSERLVAEVAASTQAGGGGLRVSTRVMWRAGAVLLAVVGIGLMAGFIVEDGGAVFFTVLMAWFAAITMAHRAAYTAVISLPGAKEVGAVARPIPEFAPVTSTGPAAGVMPYCSRAITDSAAV